MFGLSSSGFIIKRLEDSKAELEALYRATFGAGIKTTADSVFGKIIGLQAERESQLWELMESIYNAPYPNSASDISLDKVGELTAIVRNSATVSTVTAYLAGTNTTSIPVNTLFAVQDSGVQFKTLTLTSLSGSNFSVNSLTRSGPTVTVDATAHGRSIGQFVFINGAVETEYNGLVEILTVADANTLTYDITTTPASPATGTITADPATAISCESVDTGAIEALAGTLNVIINNISGLTRVNNFEDALKGQSQETDTEFRIRRVTTLQGVAAARVEGISARLLLVSNVTSSQVFENTDMVVDGNGRPAKSIECLVLGGTDQDILDTVWDAKAGGVEPFGSTTGTVTDSQGETHDSAFSRPVSVPIYLELDLTIDSDYPGTGDDLVETAILAFGSAHDIGQDVVVFPYLITSFGDVPGITDVVVRIGLSASPTLDANIIIADTSIASFDSSRILIAHV